MLNKIIFSLLFTVSTVQATDYYVDASKGADTSPGSITMPWRSLAKVSSYPFQPGDNIYLKRGELWRETLILSAEGTKDQPITLGAYSDPKSTSNENPIVSCSRVISNKLWQGILPNGGFEDSEISHFDLNKNCDASTYKNYRTYDDNKSTFPGWTVRGSGTYVVTQKISRNSKGPDEPTGFSAQINSSNTFASITSDAFSLRSRDLSNKILSYRLQGFLKSSPGSRIAIELYSAGTVKRYLNDNAQWEIWSPNIKRKPIKVVTSTQWEYFEIEFEGIIERQPTGLGYIDSENTRITVYVLGNAPARGWVDDIKLIDTSEDYWSAKTIYNHNPRIFIVDGKRVEQGSSEWDARKAWHAGHQYTVRYIPPKHKPPSTQVIEVGQRRTGIKLDGARHLILENITISGCDKSLGNGSCDGAALLLTSGASYNLIKNITTSNSDQGIRVEGKGKGGSNKDNQLVGIYSHSNRSGGIALRNHAEGNTIRNCTIHDIGMFENDSDGQDIEPISLGGGTGVGPNNVIDGCTVYNARIRGSRPAQGIIAFNAPYTSIRNNIIHDIGQSGIVLAANSSHSKVVNNVIFNTGISKESSYGAGISILADIGTMDDILVSHNTIAKCNNRKRIYGGITLRGSPKCRASDCSKNDTSRHTISNAQVINNIVDGCSGNYPFSYYVSHIDFDTLESDYNIFYNGRSGKHKNLILFEGSGYSDRMVGKYSIWHSLLDFQHDARNKNSMFDMHSVQGAPLFRDADLNDFRIRKESPENNLLR